MNDEKPKRVVLMFKPRFAPLVKAGTKKQTIRPLGKRKVEPGMIADCREWIGKPYRSKQRSLRESKILEVAEVEIRKDGIHAEQEFLQELYSSVGQFARADGFSTWSEMRDWFEKEHGLPFKGRMILWE